MKNLFSARRLTIAAATIAAAMSVAAGSQAATDVIYKYKTPKTGAIQVSPAAMTPDSGGYDYSIHFAPASLVVHASTGCFIAPVNLPQGAVITTFTVLYSSDSVDGINVRLLRNKLADGSNDELADPTMGDTKGKRKALNAPIDPDLGLINNTMYNYSVGTCVSVDTAFYGARLIYTYTNAGD
jgi:hypothetical protein